MTRWKIPVKKTDPRRARHSWAFTSGQVLTRTNECLFLLRIFSMIKILFCRLPPALAKGKVLISHHLRPPPSTIQVPRLQINQEVLPHEPVPQATEPPQEDLDLLPWLLP